MAVILGNIDIELGSSDTTLARSAPGVVTCEGVELVTLSRGQTLTNKTLTNPAINGFTGDTQVINIGSGQIYKDTSGKVGIGTSSPAFKLDVACGDADGLRISSSLNGYLTFAQGSTTTGRIIGTSSGAGELILQAQRAMQFYTGGIATPVGYSCFGPNGGLTIGNSTLNIYNIPANGLLVQNNVSVGATGVPYSFGKQLTVQFGNTTPVASSAAITCGAYSSSADSIYSLIESFGARFDGNPSFGGRYGAAYRRSDGTAIASDAGLGIYAFGGQWGTDTSFQSAKVLYPASIVGVAEGSFTSATAMPTGLSFSTGSIGANITAANVAYGTERMRLDSSGKFLLRQSSNPTNTSVSFNTAIQNALTLHENGALIRGTQDDFSNFSSYLGCTAIKSNGTIYTSMNAAGSVFSRSNVGVLLGCYYQNTSVGNIYITSTSTTFGTSSDYRLKKNIQPIQDALSRVALLKPSKYIWNTDNSEGEGFIAHELQEVVPQAVTGEKDGEQMQGVDYGKLTPLLAAAIQELAARVEILEGKT